MEKQYGVEKTDAIIEDAWRRYAEIVNENADEPKKMYMHTRKRIYPCLLYTSLVDQETWDIVQEVRSHKRRRTNMDEQNMFSGLVYCADCGKPMVLHREHTMKPEQNHFTSSS